MVDAGNDSVGRQGKRRFFGWKPVLLLLACLLAVEGGIRIVELFTGRSYALNLAARLNMSEMLYMPHPYIGFVLRPGATSPPESLCSYHVNSLGFRGAEFEEKKPPGTFRVACLGGSTTWMGSSDETTWPAALESVLRESLPEKGSYSRVEVINAGVSGYTLMESFVNLKMRVLALEPDLIVVYHAVNDARVIGRGNFRADYTHVRHPWTIPVPSALDVLLGWSHLYGLLKGRDEREIDLHELLYVRDFEKRPVSENTKLGVFNFYRTLSELVAVARVNGCEVLLTTFNYTRDKPMKMKWMMDRSFKVVDRLNTAARNVAHEQETLWADMRELVGSEAELFGDPVHMTDRGNAKFAEEMARVIQSSGMLQKANRLQDVKAISAR